MRLEIETALRLDLPIIPLTVSHATMPSAPELPESIRELASRNGQSIRPDPDFHRDMDRLISGLQSLVCRDASKQEAQTLSTKPRTLSLTESTAARLGETSFYHWFHVQFGKRTDLSDTMARNVTRMIAKLRAEIVADATGLGLSSSLAERLESGLYSRDFIDGIALALEHQYDTCVAGVFLLGYCTGVAVGNAQAPDRKWSEGMQRKLKYEIVQAAELARIPGENVRFLTDAIGGRSAAAAEIAERFWSTLGRRR